MRKVLPQLLIMLTLIAGICVELGVISRTMTKRQEKSTQYLSQLAHDVGKTRVTTKKLKTYDPVAIISERSNVIYIEPYDLRLEISGVLTSKFDSYANSCFYRSDTGETRCLYIQNVNIGDTVNSFHRAMQDFWYGNTMSICNVVRFSDDITKLKWYQSEAGIKKTLVCENTSNGTWYMLVDRDTSFLIVSAPDAFKLTEAGLTVEYGNPVNNPQLHHVYSPYEELASANQIYKLLHPKDDEEIDNPYTSDGSQGSHATFTAPEDDSTRERMVSYSKYKWNTNGTSQDTEMVVDLMSEEARRSQWNLDATAYSYSANGLSISSVRGSRSNTEFRISGNINNNIDSDRPYVIVIKFLDSDSYLLGLRVIDSRRAPLPPSGVATFNTSISSSIDAIQVQNISAIQFEVY